MNPGSKFFYPIRLKSGEWAVARGTLVRLAGILEGMPGSYAVHERKQRRWNVTNLETGAKVCEGRSRKAAVEELKRLAIEKGATRFREQIRVKLAKSASLNISLQTENDRERIEQGGRNEMQS